MLGWRQRVDAGNNLGFKKRFNHYAAIALWNGEDAIFKKRIFGLEE
ncbi:hypothetical protein H6G97_17520 [Nostoc flagelliforme FACHB-838]|uniref:Transposase n=1 Tax=Nostoc flagelliforme FACHB-838 TaxID=2692904 RepID=A0ABR8DQ89_9NOSO|nr:hypothetical protein [Nostoc flagelliforme]MBD2531288.1 hypothetical protein [Nostoc flagelliforme FACHB-838]